MTRTVFEVPFDAALPRGTRVWVTCAWKNERDMTGPSCPGVGVTLLGTGAVPTGAPLKLAA